MVPFAITLTDSNPDFKSKPLFVEYLRNGTRQKYAHDIPVFRGPVSANVMK